ncbi:hypothetical protein [Maribacter sp. IgM3_T14_3]|uniref:hypothetical protein n=1 Tax=Maribacter sp. IgM3_T14_3 TaxID=3415140 RepID=UPI003C6EB811
MNYDESINQLMSKYNITKDIIIDVEKNLLRDLEEKGFLTNCSGVPNGCDSSRCSANQSCREMRYGNCYCVNN